MTGSWLFDLRVALAFLTRLPVAPREALPPGGLAAAMRAFPLAGIVIGGLAGLVPWATADRLGPTIAALLAVAVAVWLTGGLHEDGLADTADGCGGRGDRGKRLEVMRDSRIGTYGMLALGLSLSLRVAALAALLAEPAGRAAALAALVAAGALSRAAMPLTMRLLPPARADGLGFGAGKPRPGTVLSAVVVAVATALLVLGLKAGLAAVLAGGVAMVWLNRTAARMLGGFTGDTLGALQQVVEAAVLLAVVAVR